MENELPEGWIEIQIDELTSIIAGGTPSTSVKDYFDGDIPWITPADLSGYKAKYISSGRKSITKAGLANSSARLLPKNSVLFSSRAPIGYVAIAANELATNQGFKNLTPNKAFDSSFAYYYLKHIKDYAESQASGTTFKELSGSKMGQLPFLLAPLAEQTRIVAKLDAAFGHLETLKTSLARIPEVLKKFRQTILTQAVTGKLTEVWREENILNKVNLSDLDKARFDLQETKSKERGRAKFTYKQAVTIELGGRTRGLDELYDLPETWQWVSMDQILWSVSDGPHFSPNYVSKEEGVLFISSRNIFYNTIDFSDAKYVSKEDHELFIQRGKPEVGDILLTKGGTTGIAHAIKSQAEFSIWVHVALLKVVSKYVRPEYLRDFLISSYGYIQSQLQTHGVGNQDLGLTRMIFFAIPLPPLEEQQEIVNRVEALFAQADALEAQYVLLKGKIDKLPQALLAKAFRGELVPQDLTDEPASVLLEKIKAAATPKRSKKKDSQTMLVFMDK